MELGAFSVSLAVKDIAASLAFYRKLGFEPTGGGDKWQILVNGTTVIGLFEGMFDSNILTFNPGWGQDERELDSFTDVRELRAKLEAQGIEVMHATTEQSASGPASFVVTDPDGNAILVDQHR
ncbi:MAG: VOC family protein [Myxococcales bacterium]|nr:VOC family protein [Myxococcales bacterium]